MHVSDRMLLEAVLLFVTPFLGGLVVFFFRLRSPFVRPVSVATAGAITFFASYCVVVIVMINRDQMPSYLSVLGCVAACACGFTCVRFGITQLAIVPEVTAGSLLGACISSLISK